MSSFLHPGVYVREVSSGVRVVEGVPTSTAIFVGETERGPLTPTRIKGVADYERSFGGFLRSTSPGTVPVTMRYSVGGFFANGGTSAYVLRAMPSQGAVYARRTFSSVTPSTTAAFVAADPGIWANGHLSVLVIASSSGNPTEGRVLVFYRDLRRPTDRRMLVEDFDRLQVTSGGATAENDIAQVLQRSSYVRWEPGTAPPATLGAIRDITTFPIRPTDITNAQIDGGAFDGGLGGTFSAASTEMQAILSRLDGIDDAALLVFAPDVWAQSQDADPATFGALHDEVRGYVQNRPKLDLFYIADLPAQHAATSVTGAASATRTAAQGSTTTDFMGWYWPHLRVGDPIGHGLNPTRVIPPAGFVAGLCARTDRLRGVWKAPAGVETTVSSITGVQHELLDGHQDDLNPIGVNVIRPIPGAGVVVWGSRTTVPSGEWRYVPVRRTAMFLRKSIYNGIQWAVFEPNNTDLWRALRSTIGAFMETQFRNGAFAGATSKDAYFVKCDAETTPESAQLAGVVNIVVGFAPLRPAEFVVVTLTQMTKLAS
jgi:phage tail sheath protein FI